MRNRNLAIAITTIMISCAKTTPKSLLALPGVDHEKTKHSVEISLPNTSKGWALAELIFEHSIDSRIRAGVCTGCSGAQLPPVVVSRESAVAAKPDEIVVGSLDEAANMFAASDAFHNQLEALEITLVPVATDSEIALSYSTPEATDAAIADVDAAIGIVRTQRARSVASLSAQEQAYVELKKGLERHKQSFSST